MILPVLLLVCCLTAPSPETVRLEPLPDEMVVRIDDALRLSSRFLIEQQEEDGSWRSRTYGILKDDLALTPFVLSALHNMPNGGGQILKHNHMSNVEFDPFLQHLLYLKFL